MGLVETFCIEGWGHNHDDGYRQTRIDGRTKVYCHRVAYERAFGPITDGLHIDHLCRNRSCCNPWHLEAVSQGENNRRGMGFSGLNLRKTHCPHGHEYTEANTYIRPVTKHNPNGARECRECLRSRDRRRYKAKYARMKARKATSQ